VDYVEALKWFRKAAEQEHAGAQGNLGVCYAEGLGVPQDLMEAGKWWREAAKKRDPLALQKLTECLKAAGEIRDGEVMVGYVTTGDSAEAQRLMLEAANGGHAEAQFRVGVNYGAGNGLPQNMSEAVAWFRKAAQQGHAKAQNFLAACLFDGNGVAPSIPEAIHWWQASAQQGDPDAQHALGGCYLNGTGVTKSLDEALRLYGNAAKQGHEKAFAAVRLAAEEGYRPAQLELGTCYSEGKVTPKDAAAAVKWWRLAAEQGSIHAAYYLGRCYANGDGVPRDLVPAARWFRRAGEYSDPLASCHEPGSAYSTCEAQFALGNCYAEGAGVPKDVQEAAKWYNKAAYFGHRKAKDILLEWYVEGKGLPLESAERRAAAIRGDPEAQCDLGHGFYHMCCIAKAVGWYAKAAEQGLAKAQFALAWCYDYGPNKDSNEALRWYRKAAEQGHSEAQARLQAIERYQPNCKEGGESSALRQADGEGGAPSNPTPICRSPRLRRLQSDYERVRERFADSPLIRILEAEGAPPDRYKVAYRVHGLEIGDAGFIRRRQEHIVEVSLTLDYPQRAPLCKVLTPIYHPNFDPDLSIADTCRFWNVSETLDELLIRLGRMITWQEYDIAGAVNKQAANWAPANMHMLPVDAQNLAPPPLKPTPAGELQGKSIEQHADADLNAQNSETLFQEGRSAFEFGEYGAAVAPFLTAAEGGHVRAQFLLGLLYYFGEGVAENLSQAAWWFRKAAEQGDPEAAFHLAFCYYTGEGVTKDPCEAARWFIVSAWGCGRICRGERGAYYLCSYYESPIPGWNSLSDEYPAVIAHAKNRDDESPPGAMWHENGGKSKVAMSTLGYYRQAAERGNAKAQFHLAFCLDERDTCRCEEAREWFRKAATAGYAPAQTLLPQSLGSFQPEYLTWLVKAAEQGDIAAQMNIHWQVRDQDSPDKAKWEPMAANQGHAPAQRELGWSCQREQNHNEAVEWLRKAAAQGDTIAQCNLADCYRRGEGVHKDTAQAFKWYQRSAEGGQVSGIYQLGVCYGEGLGVAKDAVPAVKCYRRAAEGRMPEAEHRLALCYHKGEGVQKDSEAAVRWLDGFARRGSDHQTAIKSIIEEVHQAAGAGDVQAQRSLGEFYFDGLGVQKDLSKAAMWWSKAAEYDDTEAQLGVGICHYYGQGVRQDRVKGAEWFRKAAEKGHMNAQFRLGMCYQAGDGVDKDPVEAFKWWLKAAELGHIAAQGKLGISHMRGVGVTRDTLKAAQWLSKATISVQEKEAQDALRNLMEELRKTADNGDAAAQFELGVCYAEGCGVTKDLNESCHWLRKAAEQGYAKAQMELGFRYAAGKGAPKNGAEAVKWWRMAAEQGDAFAQRLLVNCYANGDGVPLDLLEAFRWSLKAPLPVGGMGALGLTVTQFDLGLGYGSLSGAEALELNRDAAERGDAEAQCYLGLCYFNGDRVPRNLDLAQKWFRKAAEHEYAPAQRILELLPHSGESAPQDPVAVDSSGATWWPAADLQFNLGARFERGNGVKRDPSEAVRWYLKAAEQGYALAQHNLGNCYEKGIGVGPDAEEAVKWYGKAASQGDSLAQNNLGTCYSRGLGVPEDKAEAAKWYCRAAEQGNSIAQTNLAGCLLKGEGLPPDPQKAVTWLRKAAELGNAEAQSELAICYDSGIGVSADAFEAVKWCRKAAGQGVAAAQFNLGIRYFMGDGVTQDALRAVRWLEKAAEQGVAEAQFNLGTIHAHGQGIPQNPKEAVKWYRKAAEQGFLQAQYNLGNCYHDGDGVPQDLVEATRWWLLAAEKGLVSAQFNVGITDSAGGAVSTYLLQAHRWLSLAAAQGHEKAPKVLSEIEQQMTPEQVSEAQRLAHEFKVRPERGPDSKIQGEKGK
jgi:TPR repeat protein/ubiquitin-protein ligase